jgi:hypothetical protein
MDRKQMPNFVPVQRSKNQPFAAGFYEEKPRGESHQTQTTASLKTNKRSRVSLK